MEKSLKIQTFDGKEMNLYEISDQHLCNIVYYSRHIGMSPVMFYSGHKVRAEIQKRLNWVMLPYKPPIQSLAEIQILQDKGMLQEKDGKVLIVHEGEVIGEVVGPKSRKI